MAPGDSLAIELVWSALWPPFLLRSLCRKSKAACRPEHRRPERISSNPASRKLVGIISELGFLCGGQSRVQNIAKNVGARRTRRSVVSSVRSRLRTTRLFYG